MSIFLGPTISSMDRLNVCRQSDWSNLLSANELNEKYLAGYIDPGAEGISEMAGRVVDTLCGESLGRIRGGFGVGYPYHSLSGDRKVVQDHPEFREYLSEFKLRVEREMSRSAVWPCVDCQGEGDYSPQNCGDCTLTSLSPRDVARALPDIDMFVVVDKIDDEIRGLVWNSAKVGGFSQSDFNIHEATSKSVDVLSALSEGKAPEKFLPVDLHLISEEDYVNSCHEIAEGVITTQPEIYSMYSKWSRNNKIDFWFDFVFSLSGVGKSTVPNITEATQLAREGVVSRYSNNEIVEIVISKSPRAARVLADKRSLTILEDKLERWRNGIG